MSVLTIAETHPACEVLGPGNRFVVWVQGCPLNCRGCVSPQWIPAGGGRTVPVADLAARIVDEAVDGLTFSGGEPFAQAGALADLVDAVRARRDLSVLSYSGHTLAHLARHGTDPQRRLLSTLDILIDGPYLPRRQASLRWRGSSNQRIHLLSDRHRQLAGEPDVSAGLQFELGRDGSLRWLGVPAVADFRTRLEQRLGLVPPSAEESGR
ncbi:4Fe-4S single cluster domain-containing protein [Micromonospora sp. WMMD882]|uniref:4Fe-4S single cluster domain-containing protein n=1 Tax=Micromonospora sp. WMMD882 TaxID=3015151 RepID=UPI00248CA7D5|nr:4Fe-4S single cluster domain-containing protein [Micromonospora sp. WMMD882]WBB77770.1 4Fe-4S single cluster domain-containing protein [Micromonospora sp. WMMD882]